jgi:hypothetical protein
MRIEASSQLGSIGVSIVSLEYAEAMQKQASSQLVLQTRSLDFHASGEEKR